MKILLLIFLPSVGPIDFSSAKNIKIFGKIVNTDCNSAIENIKVEGYKCKSDSINGLKRGPNIIYLFKVDNLKICHLKAI